MSDSSDLTIRYFSDENHELRARIVSLEADVATYRAVAHQAIHALHDLTESQKRRSEQHQRLLDEYRTLREHTLRKAMAA